MMKRLLTVTILVLAAVSLRAQNVIDLIISEAMVDNTSSVVDDFGERTPWVEVFNTSQGTVNIAGCYFTDDPSNLTKSPIVKGDLRTKIGPRQVAVFFADGNSSKGTFYLNFPLREGSTLYLVSNDGRTVIDSIEIPVGIPEGQSISKFATDAKELVFDDIHAAAPSPRSVNGRHNHPSGRSFRSGFYRLISRGVSSVLSAALGERLYPSVILAASSISSVILLSRLFSFSHPISASSAVAHL